MIWPGSLDVDDIDDMTDDELIAVFVEEGGYEERAARAIVGGLRGRDSRPII